MSLEKANTGPIMHLLVILYGSRKREEVSFDRFGQHQRRVGTYYNGIPGVKGLGGVLRRD